MGTISLPAGSTIPTIDVRVYVDGARRSDIYCTGIDLGEGTSGATASLEAPGLNWDSAKGLLGKSLRIIVDGGTAFAGIVHSRSGSLSRGRNGVSLGGISYAGMMDSVYVGQGRIEDDVEFRYPSFARNTTPNQPTGWTVQSILRDIFGSSVTTWRGGGANLPGNWLSKLRLGSLGVLDRGYNQFPIGDVLFRLTTLAGALEQLLGIVGTVSFRERFSAGSTYLDFYETGDSNAPSRPVIVARADEHIDDVGANVLTIGRQDSLEGVKSRVVGCGAARRTMISITSDHPTCPLRKGWAEAGEAAVLADPERVRKYPKTIGEEVGANLEHVFRRYYIPDALRGLHIDEKNALKGSTGEELAIQVWKFPRVYTKEEDGSWTSVESEIPEEIEGAKVDVRAGVIQLSAPAIDLYTSEVVGSQIVQEFGPLRIGVTLSIAGRRLVADTGVDGPEGVADGLVNQILNESFELLAVNGEVAGHTFNSTWFFDEVLGAQEISGPLLVRDDTPLLRTYTALAQRESNKPRASYSVTIPYHTNAWRVGDRISVIGEDGYDYGTHQVRSIHFDLTRNHSTTLSTDSQVPLIYQSLGEV